MPQRLRAISLCAGPLFGALLASSASAQDPAIFERGKQVFTSEAQPQCAICHTLADAGASGEIGTNLDDLKPTEDQVRLAVHGGVGVMPAYRETLSEEQIEAVAQYVAKAVSQ